MKKAIVSRDEKNYKEYIKKCCHLLRKEFYCGEYEMKIMFMDCDDEGGAAANISISSTYLSFIIRFFPEVYGYWKAGDMEQVKRIVIHEFSHLLLDPIWKLHADSVPNNVKDMIFMTYERQTQRIANIVEDKVYKKLTKLEPKKPKKITKKKKRHVKR